jgi:REP element-mobilizing transposase RayT
MPRFARKKSITGIYHVMVRGIDKRDIFLDNEDKIKLINNLINAKGKGQFELYGYCIMDNHVHLLMKESESEEIGTSIKRITVAYAGWHNKKYERTGHLFYNRFTSEPVEDEKYLLTVIRYIHQNPLKANMVSNIENYNYSSFQQYYNYFNNQPSFIDAELIGYYFKTFEEFCKYMKEKCDDDCMEYKVNNNYNDSTINEILNTKYDMKKLLELPIDEQKLMIHTIYKNEDISIRTLSRITGISKTIIEAAVKKDK